MTFGAGDRGAGFGSLGMLPRWVLIMISLLGVVVEVPAANSTYRVTQPEPRLFPGSREFHFSLYACPGDPVELESLVQFLKDKNLSSAFDPGPSASVGSRPALEYLARLGWPVIIESARKREGDLRRGILAVAQAVRPEQPQSGL